jgi:hypothetical protein
MLDATVWTRVIDPGSARICLPPPHHIKTSINPSDTHGVGGVLTNTNTNMSGPTLLLFGSGIHDLVQTIHLMEHDMVCLIVLSCVWEEVQNTHILL